MQLKSHLYLLPCLSALTGRKIVSIYHFVYLLDIAPLEFENDDVICCFKQNTLKIFPRASVKNVPIWISVYKT